jgi:Cu/Ag efflux pump CusA
MPHTSCMPLNALHGTLAVLWALTVFGVGLLGQVTSPTAWIALIGVAVLPMLLMVRSWNEPVESISESIRKVLR